jgi:pilus assembly protein Flp/PilA
MKKALMTLKSRLLPHFNKEKGATMVEYAIMLALIAVVSIAMIKILGQQVNNTFSTISSSMSTTG